MRRILDGLPNCIDHYTHSHIFICLALQDRPRAPGTPSPRFSRAAHHLPRLPGDQAHDLLQIYIMLLVKSARLAPELQENALDRVAGKRVAEAEAEVICG